MVNEEGKIELSHYKEIQVISQKEKSTVTLVIDTDQTKLAIKKSLTGIKPDIYYKLKEISNVHIPKIYLIREDNDIVLEVEEFIEGTTLQDIIVSKDIIPEERIISLLEQLFDALKELHSLANPIIHRDIKPSNIMLTNNGVLKLIDFDASREYKKDMAKDTVYLGTMEYAAPEQFGYSQTDARSDIYAIGMLLLEFMKKAETEGIVYKHIKSWKRIINKCTMFDPNQRFQNINELQEELTNLKKPYLSNKIKLIFLIPITILCIVLVIVISKSVIKKEVIPDNSGGQITVNSDTQENEEDIKSDQGVKSASNDTEPTDNTDNKTDLNSLSVGNNDIESVQEGETVEDSVTDAPEANEEPGEEEVDTVNNSKVMASLSDNEVNNTEKQKVTDTNKAAEVTESTNSSTIDAVIANNFIDYYKNKKYSEDLKIYVVFHSTSNVEFLSLSRYGNIDKKYYKVSGNIITLSKEYLDTLPNDYYDLSIGFNKGNAANMQVEVHAESEDSIYGEYRLSHYNKTYYTNDPEDFIFLIYNSNSARIVRLWNGDSEIEGKYYKIEDNGFVVTLYKDIMKKMKVGSIFNITIELDNGVKKEVTAQVLEKAIKQPSLNPANYTFYKSDPEDFLIKIVWNDAKQVTQFITNTTDSSGEIGKDNYIISEKGILIKKEALKNYKPGEYQWQILFDTGYGNQVNLTVVK